MTKSIHILQAPMEKKELDTEAPWGKAVKEEK
jgi:hypothetical protein